MLGQRIGDFRGIVGLGVLIDGNGRVRDLNRRIVVAEERHEQLDRYIGLVVLEHRRGAERERCRHADRILDGGINEVILLADAQVALHFAVIDIDFAVIPCYLKAKSLGERADRHHERAVLGHVAVELHRLAVHDKLTLRGRNDRRRRCDDHRLARVVRRHRGYAHRADGGQCEHKRNRLFHNKSSFHMRPFGRLFLSFAIDTSEGAEMLHGT